MNLNEQFEIYRSSPTELNLEALYPKVREHVVGVLRWRMAEVPEEGLIVSVTTDVILAIPKFNVEAGVKFSTWITSIIRNFAVDEGRRRRRAPLSLFDSENEPIKSLTSKDDPSFSVLLREVFEQLTPEEQTLLAGKLEKVPGAELAEKLGISASLVRKRWERLREKLRHILGGSSVSSM
jgi:RNA polymerase sigma factor (sigma-70 family)